MPADFVMMGGQFEVVGGDEIKLVDVDFGANFEGPAYGDGTSFVDTAPQVQIAFPDREGNTKYYFLCDGKYDPSNPKAVEGYVPGWVDGYGTEVDPTIGIGIGFWYCDTFNKNRAFNGCGQIVVDSPWEKTFNADFRMLVCPFPKAVKLSEINFVDIDASAVAYGDGVSFIDTATHIQIPFPDREGFSKYYYLIDGKYDPSNPKAVEGYVPGWVDSYGTEIDPTTIEIPAGRGCWFRPAVEMTVEFSL